MCSLFPPAVFVRHDEPPTQGESSLGLAKLKSGEQECEKPRDVYLAKSTQAVRNLSGTCSLICRTSTSSLDDETVLQSTVGNSKIIIKSSDSSKPIRPPRLVITTCSCKRGLLRDRSLDLRE